MIAARSEIAMEDGLRRTPLDLVSLVSIAAVAAAFAGLGREAMGRALAAQLSGADWFGASPIFAQINTPTRFAGLCGTLATLALGGIAAVLLRFDKRLTAGWYFLWVFGCVSLMNSGRLLYSAISGTGDWSVVMSSLNPPWLWRILLAAAGIFIYRPALRFAAAALRVLVVHGELAYQDLWRLVLTAYLTAGVVLTAGAFLNPANGGVVSVAAMGASFGLNSGLLVVPLFISQPVETEPIRSRSIAFSWFWLAFAVVAAIAFLAGLGRAIHF